jgi:predicted TIM-barrel fold metal-dependent hydrolase
LEDNLIFSTGATIMYIYWRVQQDLNEMANTIIFHHPNLVRAFKKWCKKNAAGLRMAQDLGPEELTKISMSLN